MIRDPSCLNDRMSWVSFHFAGGDVELEGWIICCALVIASQSSHAVRTPRENMLPERIDGLVC